MLKHATKKKPCNNKEPVVSVLFVALLPDPVPMMRFCERSKAVNLFFSTHTKDNERNSTESQKIKIIKMYDGACFVGKLEIRLSVVEKRMFDHMIRRRSLQRLCFTAKVCERHEHLQKNNNGLANNSFFKKQTFICNSGFHL
jgi:hypothetical protein